MARGLEGIDQEQGSAIPPAQRSTALLLKDLADVLARVGAGPADVVSTTFFQRDIMAMPVVGRARAEVFVERHPPSGSIPALRSPFFQPDLGSSLVGVHTTSALASTPDSSEGQHFVSVEDSSGVLSATRVDVSGGLAYTSLLAAQSSAEVSKVLEVACGELEKAGLKSEDVVVAMVYVSSSVEDANDEASKLVALAREAVAAHFQRSDNSRVLVVSPPVECVIDLAPTTAASDSPDTIVVSRPIGIQLIAAPTPSSVPMDGAGGHSCIATDGGKYASVSLVKRPSSLVFTGTLASLDHQFEVTSDSVEDQVAYTLQLLQNVLDDVGTTLDNVLAINLYIVDADKKPHAMKILQLVRDAFKASQCPVFSVVGISPLLLPRLHFELCAVAALP